MRLIDADKLISCLKDWLLYEAPYGVCEPESPQYETIKECIEAVNEQPTAYDVDKVVEQLEDESEVYCREYGKEDGELYLQGAIEVVEAGGVGDM